MPEPAKTTATVNDAQIADRISTTPSSLSHLKSETPYTQAIRSADSLTTSLMTAIMATVQVKHSTPFKHILQPPTLAIIRPTMML